MMPLSNLKYTNDSITIDTNALVAFAVNNMHNPLRLTRLNRGTQINLQIANATRPIANNCGTAISRGLGVTATGIQVDRPIDITASAAEHYKSTRKAVEQEESGRVRHTVDGFPIDGVCEQRAKNENHSVTKEQSSDELISIKLQDRCKFLAYKYVRKQDKRSHLDGCNGHSHIDNGKELRHHAIKGFSHVSMYFKRASHEIIFRNRSSKSPNQGSKGRGWFGFLKPMTKKQSMTQGCH